MGNFVSKFTSVVDPLHLDADPDSSYHPDADPESEFLFDTVRIWIRLFSLMRKRIRI
jgi:hypothetical protein